MVDVKLNGRIERAQTFAKAVIFSLFVLVVVAYMRWNSFMEVKVSNEASSSTLSDENVVKGLPIRHVESESHDGVKYSEQVRGIKSQLHDNLHKRIKGKSSNSSSNSDDNVSRLQQDNARKKLRQDSSNPLGKPPSKSSVENTVKEKEMSTLKRSSLRSGSTTTVVLDNVPILSEHEKVRLNHPKKEVYQSLDKRVEAVNEESLTNLRRAAGNSEKVLPLSTLSHSAATSSRVTVATTSGKHVTLLTGAAAGTQITPALR